MDLYYSLSNSLVPEKIIRDIDKLISQHIKDGNNPQDSVMIIQIRSLSNYSGDSLLPKLTHKDTKDL